MKIVTFSGPSNSGKTTLICKVAKKFIENGFKVCIAKHDPKDKAVFDDEKKDSGKFSAIGADVIVTSPSRTTFFAKRYSNLDDLLNLANGSDIFIIEGLKEFEIPRISLFCDKFDKDYEKFSDAVATNGFKPDCKLPWFHRDDIEKIYKWILKNAKEI